jgi:hypothetical protein
MNIKRPLFIFLLLAILAALAPELYAEESSFRATGYIKSFFLAVDPADVEGLPQLMDQPAEGIVQNRVRLKLSWTLSDSVVGELAYDIMPRVQGNFDLAADSLLPRPEPFSYRVKDFRRKIYPEHGEEEGSFVLAHNLDRAFFILSPDFADFYIGRQPIAFGSARAVNPTDVLAPFTYEELDKEERIGVDAVRAKIPIGAMGEFDLGVVLGDDLDRKESAAFVRSRLYALATDITLTTIAFRDNLLGGADIARALGDAGFWLEAAYTFAQVFDDRQSGEDYFRLTSGIDYNFACDLYVYVEYHFNGAAEDEPEDYLLQINEASYRDAGVYLLGRHYIIPGLSYQFTPLLIFSGSMLANAADGSIYFSPRLEYSFSEDVYLEAGAFVAYGEKAKFVADASPGAGNFEPKSEFGLYPNMYFTSIRIYF